MRNRRFGVEIEFSSHGRGSRGIGEALTDAGYGNWVGAASERYDSYYGRYEVSYPGIGYDGSELELRSPILQGVDGFKQLKGVLKVLNDLGCSVTRSDGLHVHHDAPEYVDDKPLLIQLLKSWEQNQENISTFITPERAMRHGGPCAIILDAHIMNFEAHRGSTYGMREEIAATLPRGNLNLCALYEHGSIEFRYLEGTLDYDVIESWIKFGQAFLNNTKSRKSPIPRAENPVVLLNRLRAGVKTRKTLVYKALNAGHKYDEMGVEISV